MHTPHTHHKPSTSNNATKHAGKRGGTRMSQRAIKVSVAAVTVPLIAAGAATVNPANALDLTPRGIDVASHQHPGGTPINWQRVRLSGYTFTIIKATEGTGYTNPYFKQDRAGSHSVGMIVGSYHYARPNQNPITQALHYADTIDCQKRPMELPPVLDLEETGGLPPLLLQGW